MDLNEKLKYLKDHINSVSRHDDEDLVVREHALDVVMEYVETERQAARERATARAQKLKLISG